MPKIMTIKSMMTQFIGCFSNGKLTISTRLTPGSLLIDAGTRPEDCEPDGYHQYYRDPVGGVPAKYDSSRIGH